MKQAILSVTVDEANTVEVRFQGDQQFHIPMLGAVEIARSYVLDQIRTNQLVSLSGKGSEEDGEKEVSRDEAIGVYLAARQKIEDRLQAIVRSNEAAKFTVDNTLFAKL